MASQYRPLADDGEAANKGQEQDDNVPLLPVDEEELCQGTIFGSVANLSNTILGTGKVFSLYTGAYS